MSNIIEVENVSKHFTHHTALDRVSLSIPEGSVYGLLGPNGAGKTTLIRIINHITAPDSGVVRFSGHPLVESDVMSIGYLPEERGLYKKMKVGEQAVFFARLKGLSRRDATARLKEWFEKFGISEWWDKKVEELSKGMAQKVQFIVTVLHRPRLLIFDEPFSGFDPINANLLKDEILQLNRDGATVIFSTHNMASVEALCDEITLINKSRNILSGNVANIRSTMGGNRYSFTVAGNIESVSSDLDGKAESIQVCEPSGNSPVHNLIITPAPGIEMRDIVSIINDRTEIRAMEQMLPSMEDIFIKTVEQYDNEHKTVSDEQ